jgi:hypothetical protein
MQFRYDHSAVVYTDQYLHIFGGSSHSTLFEDLKSLITFLKHVSIPFFATVSFYAYSNMFLCLCCGVGWLEGFLYFWCEVNGGSDIIRHDLRRSQLPWLVTVA